MSRLHLGRIVIISILGLLASVMLVSAFAEEHITFRDPHTGELTDDEISTIHNDLTYVLALAAGFDVTDSLTLQIWNQLVDSEQLGPDEAISYTNCLGAFPEPPDPDVVCQGKIHNHLIWPMWDKMQDSERCTTSRFGPYSPFFHFPHNNAAELGALHDWAWGLTDVLYGYEAYAWGRPLDMTIMQATCLYTRPVTITMGIAPGSLEAFGTYLHSLADYYSHRDCIAAMDDMGMPWATHTLTGCPPCDYNPFHYSATDVHGREFYTYTDSLRTDEAISHVYRELVARSLQREGQYYPLDLTTPISGTQTLGNLLSAFVHTWDYDHPEERRALADQMASAILAQREPMYRAYVPATLRRLHPPADE